MMLQIKKRENTELINEKIFNQYETYEKLLRKTPIYEIYGITLMDTQFVLVKSKFFNTLMIRDNDNNVIRSLYVFEEEMKLKPFLFDNIPSNEIPSMEYKEDKVVIRIGKENMQPDIVKIINPIWDFLFKYEIKFYNVILKMKKWVGLILEIPIKEYANAIFTILGGMK